MHKFLHKAAEYSRQGHPKRRAYVGAVGIRTDGTHVYSHNERTNVARSNEVIDIGTALAMRNHAEARVIQKLDYGSVVFVARTQKDTGDIVLAKPCAGCYTKLRNKGISKCYYSISENEYGCIEF